MGKRLPGSLESETIPGKTLSMKLKRIRLRKFDSSGLSIFYQFLMLLSISSLKEFISYSYFMVAMKLSI
jgi:hypothetical protein